MLDRRVGEKLGNKPGFKIVNNELDFFLNEHDFVVGNLECPVSNNAQKWKSTGFKANPISLLQLSSFDLFSLANNHIFDCGKKGAADTIQDILQNKQQFTGLVNQANKNAFYKTTVKNKTFSFLSCALYECIKDPDNKEYPRVLEAENTEVLSRIKKGKASSNYVIVLVHGGDEMISYPKPNLRNLCESYIDLGADVVITHHPHVLGGVHHYKNKYIFYSLGDFIFDGESYLRRRGLVVSINFDENNISHQVLPTQIKNDLSVGLPNKQVKSITELKWNKISNIIQKDKKYNSKYKRRYIYSLILFQFDRLSFLLKYKGIFYLLKFILKKVSLLPFYFKKVISKNT